MPSQTPEIVVDASHESNLSRLLSTDDSLSERKPSRRNSSIKGVNGDAYKEVDINSYFEEQHQQLFRALQQEDQGHVFVRDLFAALAKTGIAKDSPLLKDSLDGLDEEEELTYEQFSAALKKNTRLETMLKDQMVLPNFSEFVSVIEEIFNETKGFDGGKVATYIPQLARVDPELYAVSVCTVDGQRLNLGDSKFSFCAQSTSKPITYAIACELRGEETVHKHVGREPSGRNFNELVLNDESLPHNPLINSGAIMSASLIKPECSMAERYEFAVETWKKLTGGSKPRFGNAVYLSERATADQNFCLGHMMKEKGAFEKESDLVEALELYFMFCSIELNSEEMACVAATLANAGVCPFTEEVVFKPRTVRNCLSMMASCGMYDFSGEFAFQMGFPAKSGVSGALMIVIPGLMGLCVFSPRLDKLGNSVRGNKFCDALAARFKFHSFDNLVGLSDPGKIDPRREKKMELSQDFVSFWWAASRGDLFRLRQLIARGINPNCVDYDKRTALHIAAAYGHVHIVQYLCFCGANPTAQDRYGKTPLEEAKRANHEAVALFLGEMIAPSSVVSPFTSLAHIEQVASTANSHVSTDDLSKKKGRKMSAELIEIPENLRDHIGNMHQFFLSVNSSLSTKTTKAGLRKFLRDTGISINDPRLASLQLLPSSFDESVFVAMCENNEFLQKILRGQLIIPNFPAFSKDVDSFFEKAALAKGGEVYSRLPTLASVNPEQFGVAICSIDGQRYARGDTQVKFPVVNISKAFTYCLALEELGIDYVHKFVGREPSGRNFNDLSLNSDKLPHNPLIDSGGILCASLIQRSLELPDRYEKMVDIWAAANGNKRPSFANANYLCEKDTCDRNYSLGYLMKARQVFPEGTDLEEVISLYCMLNSIELSADDLSVVAATLANGGVCPLTNHRVFKPSTVRAVLSLMSSCGVYDYSGEWLFSFGVPAKSSSSGAMLIVIPNVMGICTFSPRLDRYGLSVRGVEFCRMLTSHFTFHTYDKAVRTHHLDPREYHGSNEESHIAQLCYAAMVGDLAELRRVMSHGVDVNGADYDGRTALHVAVSESQFKTVQFLILFGADVTKKDNWGQSPMDEANRTGNKEMIKMLDKAVRERAAKKNWGKLSETLLGKPR